MGKVLVPLGRDLRVVAADLRGHGDGIRLRSRFRLEDCADDIAALAGVLDIGRFAAVGYSMGGLVAQVLYRRHAALLSGLVLCSTAGNARRSRAEQLAALAMPAVAAALRWNPMLHLMGAEFVGMALLGRIDDPATGRWARAQLRRTTLATVVSATEAVCEFSSDSWLGQVDVPTAVVITARDRVVPPGRQLALARAVPGASVHSRTPVTGPASRAARSPRAARGLLVGSARPRPRTAHTSLTPPARDTSRRGRLGAGPRGTGSRGGQDGVRGAGQQGNTRCRALAHERGRLRSAAPDNSKGRPNDSSGRPESTQGGTLEAPRKGSVQHPGLQVHAHQPRCGPLAAARGHPCPRTELGYDPSPLVRGRQGCSAAAGSTSACLTRGVQGSQLGHEPYRSAQPCYRGGASRGPVPRWRVCAGAVGGG